MADGADAAQLVSSVILAVGGLIGSVAGAYALIARAGRARSKADAREIDARAAHQRVLLRVIRKLRGIIAGCADCEEPEGIDDQIAWEFNHDD